MVFDGRLQWAGKESCEDSSLLGYILGTSGSRMHK